MWTLPLIEKSIPSKQKTLLSSSLKSTISFSINVLVISFTYILQLQLLFVIYSLKLSLHLAHSLSCNVPYIFLYTLHTLLGVMSLKFQLHMAHSLFSALPPQVAFTLCRLSFALSLLQVPWWYVPSSCLYTLHIAFPVSPLTNKSCLYT